MKRNTDNCHLVLSENIETQSEVSNSLIKGSACEKLRLTTNSVLMNTLDM